MYGDILYLVFALLAAGRLALRLTALIAGFNGVNWFGGVYLMVAVGSYAALLIQIPLSVPKYVLYDSVTKMQNFIVEERIAQCSVCRKDFNASVIDVEQLIDSGQTMCKPCQDRCKQRDL